MSELPEGWMSLSLGRAGRWMSGGTPSTSKAEFWGGEIPWIGSGSLTDFRLVDSDRRVTPAGVANGTRLVERGTILMVVRGMSLKTDFRIGWATKPMAFGQDCKALVAGPGIDPTFLAYAILAKTPAVLGIVDEAGHGTGRLNTDQLFALTIGLPGPQEQWAIAEVLGTLDDKMAANIGIVTTADAIAASLTRSALDMTQHVALEEIALVTMGSSPPGTSYNEAGEGTVFYQGVSDFGTRYPANRVWTTEPVRMAEAGDCLLSVRAPVGRLNLSGEITCIGRGLASLRSRAASPMTLFHLLRDAPEAWEPYEAEGTIFGSINRTQLESLRLPTVSEELAEGLERQLGALEASIASCLDENVKLATMRDALLPQLMSGKIRVRDAEQMVGDVV